MVQYLKDSDFEIRASLGIVKDYYATDPENIVDRPSDYNMFLEMYTSDPVLSSAIDTTVDVGGGTKFHFEGKNKAAIKKLDDLFVNTLDFDIVLRNLIYCMIIYGDAYLEVRYIDGAPSELHSLEPTEMKIRYDKHGEILGFVQESLAYPDQKVYFTPDEVIHFSLKNIGSRVYSYEPFKPIMREYITKKYANHYMSSIFANFPPRLLYTMKTASKEQTKNFIEILKKAKRSPNKDLVGWGDIEMQQAGVFDFSKGLVDILNYLRSEILMITKVPPIWMGIPDNSNRSNSEAQIRSFETRVKSILNKIASAINKKLLPIIGHSVKSAKFVFEPFTLTEEKSSLDNAKVLKDIGLDDDTIIEYIRSKGVNLRVEASIKEVENTNIFKENNTTEGNSNRGADSNSEGRKTILDANGVSAAGKKKTEEKDAKLRTALPSTAQFW